MRAFSAIGYYFARRLQSEINVPIGIINSSWGGTPAETWMTKEAVESDKVLLKNSMEKKQEPWGPKDAGYIYNAMIAPITNFKIKGSLWYQGESNVSHADDYDRLLSTLVGSWRKNWGYEFPFYYVQIAPYKYGGDGGVRLRESQRRAESIIPNCAMIVISDIGNIDDIHPRNKKDVGIRLANIALSNQYQIKGLDISGPSLKDYQIKGNKITLNFNSRGPLVCNDACKYAFELSDNHNSQKAKVFINGSSITLGD
jgi:sialate O-acetylesterase